MSPAPSPAPGLAARRPRARLALCFLGIFAALVWARACAPIAEHPWPAAAAAAAAGAAWCAALATAARAPGELLGARALVASALALRLAVAGADLGLSDDQNRYAFEGELVRAARSPYAHAPADAEVADLAARMPRTFAALNHPEVPAAYPPATELLFGLGTGLARLARLATGRAYEPDRHAAAGVRLVFAAFDVAVLAPLLALLAALGRRRTLALAWAWSPLVAVEFAGSAHFDSAGIFALVLALALRARGGRGASASAGVALGCAALVKYLPIAALAFLARGSGGRRFLAAFLATCAALALPFLAFEPAGFGGGRGLAAYALRWESTSLVHRFLEAPLAEIWPRDGSWTDPRRLARAALGALWLAALGWLWLRRTEPWRAAGLAIGLFLVLSPTLHPWYATWIVPFVALRPTPAWCWLCAASPALYAPLVSHQRGAGWSEPAWLWPFVALPFFVLAWRTARRAAPRALSA